MPNIVKVNYRITGAGLNYFSSNDIKFDATPQGLYDFAEVIADLVTAPVNKCIKTETYMMA